jgi:putative SOS response-associated peptidase YedK
MCGRFVLIATAEELVEKFRIAEAQNIEARYNIAPTQQVAAVREQEGARKLDSLRWGLVPFWAKDSKIGARMINARAETVNEKPAFRAPFKKGRCIVPASGFYEWARRGGEKRPYYIRLKDSLPFGIAALWDAWEGEGGVIESCTLITTSANKLVSKLHDRMPVILPPDDYDAWLDPAFNDKEKLKMLLHPFSEKEMECYEVSKEVNSPKNDTPDLIMPI